MNNSYTRVSITSISWHLFPNCPARATVIVVLRRSQNKHRQKLTLAMLTKRHWGIEYPEISPCHPANDDADGDRCCRLVVLVVLWCWCRGRGVGVAHDIHATAPTHHQPPPTSSVGVLRLHRRHDVYFINDYFIRAASRDIHCV